MIAAFWNEGIPWATTTEVDFGTITKTRETISEHGLKSSAAKIAPPGTLLLAMYGQGKTRGKVAILGIPAAMNQACAAIEPGPDVNSSYLFYYLTANYENIRILSNSGGQENLSGQIVKSIRVGVPPLREQVTISDALSDANDLITSLERLIAKKQAIKQGMMQQLLTGRGCREDFVPLGSVTSWLSGGTPNRSNPVYWSGTIPWISATSLKKLEVATSDQAVTPAAVVVGSKMAPLGSTLLLVRGSALHSEIRASLVTAPVCFNQDVKALVPSERVVPKFLTYSIHGNADNLLRLVTSAGNTAGVLDTRVVKSFELWIPSRTQQQKVVTVLDDVSDELVALQSRLAKAKDIKHGMMQELLTGRTRLPVEEAAA